MIQLGEFEARGRQIDSSETLDSAFGPEGNDNIAVDEHGVRINTCQYPHQIDVSMTLSTTTLAWRYCYLPAHAERRGFSIRCCL